LAAVLGLWTLSAAATIPHAADQARPDKIRPGLTEFAGERIPAGIRAVDDRGRTVRLVELIDRPTLLVLVYYTCEHVCPLVLGALGGLASDPALAIGRDYRIVTLSFDAADTAADAATARANYTKPVGRELPDGAWTFLTAPAEDIALLTEVLGFRYVRSSHGFIHPSVLVVLGPGGRISSYLRVSRTAYGVGYPVTFPPGAIAAALRLAAEGASGPQDPAPLLFCYPDEPRAQGRFYGLMTAMGAGTLVLLAGLFVYISLVWKRPPPGAGGP
jgi:protein SCO1